MDIDKKCEKCQTRHSEGKCIEQKSISMPLATTEIDQDYLIVCNPFPKYFEMGLSHGSNIHIIKNNTSDRNLIIGVGESRYIISRNIAKQILVRKVA